MKRILVLLCILFFSVSYACATEASKYAAQKYSETTGSRNVRITVKKEHTEECTQKIGEADVFAITYGYGDMKVKGKRKARISYICLLDKNCDIIWSCIIPR